MSKPKSVISHAQELLETVGKEEAIKHFQDKIDSLTPPKNFQEICMISGNKTAIDYLNGKFDKKE